MANDDWVKWSRIEGKSVCRFLWVSHSFTETSGKREKKTNKGVGQSLHICQYRTYKGEKMMEAADGGKHDSSLYIQGYIIKVC